MREEQNTQTTTADAAKLARVSVRTVRLWCRLGAVAAVKTAGRWVIDLASLRHRIALARRTVAKQLAAFRDAKSAQGKAAELLELGALVPAARPYQYVAIASNGIDGYLVDTLAGSCTCKGHLYSARCYHLAAAVMLESAPAPLALAA
jgi:hypothetical protein